jgi:hypothetical protein
MYEHDVDGLLDMYERDEYSLDDPPVELPAPYSSVALSAFLCLDAQHATQAGALHTSTPHTPAITAPVCPSTATAQMPFTSINVAPAASCYAEPDAAHFITASAVSPPAAPSNTMDCTAKHASKDGPGVGTPCKLADQEVASAPTKIAKKCDKKPSKPVKAIVHSGKPVRKACPAACARLTDTTTGRKPGHRSFPWGAVWVKALVMKMRCAGASNTVSLLTALPW